jgi:hypothetical protein
MSKRTRYFLLGAVAFLVLGLSIGTVAYYNGGFKTLKSAAGPAELQFVPEDAAVVAYANVQQIMKSDFRQRMKQLEAGKGERGQQEFKDETGIDIENDIDTVVAYMTPKGTNASDTSGVVMATGRFNQQRIADLVRQKGGTVGDYNGRPFMKVASSSHPDNGGALAFLSANQVALGSEAAVRRTVDIAANKATPGNVTNNGKMMDLITRVDNGNAWVVGRFDALSSQAHLPEQVMSQIPPISWFSASGNIDGGVSGRLSVEATDAAAAQNLLAVIQGLKGLAALQARSNNVPSQIQQMLNSFQVAQDDKTLTLSFSIPSDLLNGLVNMKAATKK